MKRVLICHPNDYYRKALIALLEISLRSGYVFIEESAVSINKLRNEKPPDYFLLSQNEQSDEELVNLIKSITRTISVKLIVLTFFDSEIYRAKLKSAGAHGVYRIDLNIEKLIELLN